MSDTAANLGMEPIVDPPAPLLEVKNLATGYGDIRAVWDVSLSVHAGKLTAVLGRNGAGKTTTLRAIAGLNKVSAGSINYQGKDISGLQPHRRVTNGIAFVQDGKRVFHRLTVQDNLFLGGYTLGIGRRKMPKEVARIFEIFPVLGERAKVVAGQMSGGQQQMLAIGQALMAKPALLMLDEPSGGLAPSIVGEVMETVATLKTAGIGVLLVEQQVEAAIDVADHVVVLDIGRVILDSPASEIVDLDVLKEAYFGSATLEGEEPGPGGDAS
jgi:branched-chain amino acid transport system ATP-binding protein